MSRRWSRFVLIVSSFGAVWLGHAPRAAAEPPDIVETIDDSPLPGPVPVVQVAPSASERFTFHGWARQSLELGFADEVFHEARPDPYALRYDKLIARSQLLLRAGYSLDRWFEATISGSLHYAFFEQAPGQPGETFNGFNGQARRGSLEARLYELFLGFFSERLDVRIGQQRLSWGRSELGSPNDVIDARDLRDPLLSEPEMRVLPTWLLRADLDLGFGSLQAVVSPAFVPNRADSYGSNWAGLQPDAPRGLRGISGILDRALDPTLHDRVQRLLEATRLPTADFTEPVAGARFSWTVGGVDVNHYYQYGFDGPHAWIAPDLAAILGSADFRGAGLADLQPLLALIDAGLRPFDVSYVRRHHVGSDIAFLIGSVAVRLEAAYQSRRVFYRQDLSVLMSPVVDTVAELEYQTASTEKVIILAASYMRALESNLGPLLLWSRDSMTVAGFLRWPLWGGFGVELRAIIGVQPRTQVIQPALTFKAGIWLLAFGGTWLHGERYSLGDYFRRNTGLHMTAKLAF
jgi:hypothetical protein